ncbi:MAG: ATP-binding cassette domain-containing protein [Bacteroidetes bacterium]|nr:ATP-binding cassette domain-containing protein [Bacteroidota bacterium]
MKQILEFDSVSLNFGLRTILSSVSMNCATGEVVGLLGRNGSGKSCLMKIVFGCMNAEFKSVRINKSALYGNYLSKKQIGYLPQETMIPSYLTIRTAIKFFRLQPDQIIERLPFVKNWLDLKPYQCSGGSLRLLETMIIVLADQPFCFLDEPFSGLMPTNIEIVKDLIVAEKNRKGIIISDHLYRHVKNISDKIYILANGQTYLMKNEEHLVKYGYLNEI